MKWSGEIASNPLLHKKTPTMSNIELSNSDAWFISSLECIIGIQELRVKLGESKQIDRQAIVKFAQTHTNHEQQ